MAQPRVNGLKSMLILLKRVALAAFYRDITDRKQAELERKQLNEKTEHLVSLSKVIIAEDDLETLLTKVSKAALALTGGRMAACGHGFGNMQFAIGTASWLDGISTGLPSAKFNKT